MKPLYGGVLYPQNKKERITAEPTTLGGCLIESELYKIKRQGVRVNLKSFAFLFCRFVRNYKE